VLFQEEREPELIITTHLVMIGFTALCVCVWLQCVGPNYTKIWVGLRVLGWLLCLARIAGLVPR